MNRFLHKIVAAAVISGVSLTSCESYLDVNDNPNYPIEADISTLLPSACASTIAVLGYNGVLIGTMWLQFTTQGNTTNQYNTLCNYSLSTSSYTSFWRNAYVNTLPDLKDIITTSESEEMWDYWVIAKVLTAYNYHILTDLYEDIPFTEALDNENYPQPNYDDSRTVVYPGIIDMLDEAIDRISDAEANPSTGIDEYDMFLEGDMDSWRKFAKNLKLKVMMRDFDTYSSEISSLLSEDDFLEEDCAFTDFEDATNKGNPLYEYNIRQELAESDLVVGSVLIPGAKAPKLVTRDMLKVMKKGSVMVDVAIDQGGCFETSHPTTHQDPVYEVDGIVHYAVANIPGAVARTSTLALTNATIPYALQLADKGWKRACKESAELREGLNIVGGKVVYKGVAEAWNLPYTPVEEVL